MNAILPADMSLSDPLAAYELFAVLAAIPLFVLFRRAGLKPWPAVFVFVPLLGFCLAGTALVYPRWPALPESRRSKSMGG